MKTLCLTLFLISCLICFNCYADLEVDGTATVSGFKMITGAAEGKVLTSDLNGVGTWRVLPASAGILSVTGTNGIISNTVSGNVTLQADTAYLQRRVAGSCTAGNSIRVINQDGTVTCEAAGGGSNNWTLGGTNLYTHDVDLGQNWKVGIGTNTPSQKLSINGNLELSNSSNPRIIYLGADKFIQQIGGANTFLGIGAGSNTPTNPGVVDYNTGIGFNALLNNIGGGTGQPSGDRRAAYNTAVGSYALITNTDGYHNTAIGSSALNGNTTGHDNTAIGYGAGWVNQTGFGNVFIGFLAGANETGSNKLYIANSSINPPLIYGDFATGRVGLGTIIPAYKFQVVIDGSNEGHVDATGAWARTSDIRLKKNVSALEDPLSKLLNIRGVSYNWRNQSDSDNKSRHIGFVAQELEKEFPEFVDTGTDGYKSVAYESITPVLVEAIKALKAENDTLKKRIEVLESKQVIK